MKISPDNIADRIGMRNIIVGFRDKGAIFENIVFMKIKDQDPKYVYQNGQEIDFFTNGRLIEVKYHRDIEGKQLMVFDKFKAQHKMVIKNYVDLKKL